MHIKLSKLELVKTRRLVLASSELKLITALKLRLWALPALQLFVKIFIDFGA